MLIIERLEWNLRASELDVVEFLVIRTLIAVINLNLWFRGMIRYNLVVGGKQYGIGSLKYIWFVNLISFANWNVGSNRTLWRKH